MTRTFSANSAEPDNTVPCVHVDTRESCEPAGEVDGGRSEQRVGSSPGRRCQTRDKKNWSRVIHESRRTSEKAKKGGPKRGVRVTFFKSRE